MKKPVLQIGRNLSEHRIGAYECTVAGPAVKRGKWVVGWYGMCDERRLKEEIFPKLSEYANQGACYPFLITSYMLESKTDVWIETHGQKAKAKDVNFRPRRRRTAQQTEAVAYSATSYELLQLQ